MRVPLFDSADGQWQTSIRDTRAAGAERYHWTVTVFGEPGPVADGRTAEQKAARSAVEAALAGYAASWREGPRDGSGDDG
jgi:hypothetical protein